MELRCFMSTPTAECYELFFPVNLMTMIKIECEDTAKDTEEDTKIL